MKVILFTSAMLAAAGDALTLTSSLPAEMTERVEPLMLAQ